MKRTRFLLYGSLFLLTACGTAPQINQGVHYFNQGQYDLAAQQWNGPAKQGDYVAQYNLGLLWRDGLGSTQKNLEQAADWFYLSAKQGYVPAMVRLAEVQIIVGNEQHAVTWLNLAARWGNSEAIQHLRQRGRKVPAADLLYAKHQSDARVGTELGMIVGQLISGGTYNDSGMNPGSGYRSSHSPTTQQTGNINICNCKGYAGPGGPCYSGPGGPAYNGPGGPAYDGPGGPCYKGYGGPKYDGYGGPEYDGYGGPKYDGYGGSAYDGYGGPANDGYGGPCYAGFGGPCYSGPGGTGENCPAVCK